MNIHPSHLPSMAGEVRTYCKDKGWYDQPVPFDQATALLHEEVSEAGHAWRVWGLEDGTNGSATIPGGNPNAKPEGVGSEFADILIRWLDDETRFNLGAIEYLDSYEGAFAVDENFLANMNTLHVMLARVTIARDTCYEDPVREMAAVLVFLFQLADHYKIDLYAEYERKMRYNRSRAYRHGGRRA
jgi:NTP pyrophosphatase (non-canonical NTP hydrolase)